MLVGDKYTFLEEYSNSKTKIKCRHNECGHEWEINPSNFFQGKRCPKCNRPNYNRDTEQFKQEVYDLVRDEYTVIGKYINALTKIKMKHNACNKEWNITPNKFLVGRRCPFCYGSAKKTIEQLNQEVFDLVGDEYTVLSEYKTTHEYIVMRHNICNHEYNVSPSNFLRGNRCPFCKLSRGEKKIKIYLDNKNIKYIPQHTFDNCKNIHSLQFDFYLPKNNLLIEYDGKHHFEPIDFAGKGEKWAKERFEYIKQNDNIKNQYCKDNNIPLLRIPYWEFDSIEDILFKTLSKLGVE